MPYRVFWTPDAEEPIERLLSTAESPDLIAASARQIDQFLMASSVEFGESRYNAMRIGFALPLGVQFEVMEDVHTVIVHDVWRIDRKQEGK